MFLIKTEKKTCCKKFINFIHNSNPIINNNNIHESIPNAIWAQLKRNKWTAAAFRSLNRTHRNKSKKKTVFNKLIQINHFVCLFTCEYTHTHTHALSVSFCLPSVHRIKQGAQWNIYEILRIICVSGHYNVFVFVPVQIFKAFGMSYWIYDVYVAVRPTQIYWWQT